MTSLDDPAAIYEHIDRIGRVMDTDLAQAISGAWRWRSSSAGRWFTASEGRRATSLARRAAPQPRR